MPMYLVDRVRSGPRLPWVDRVPFRVAGWDQAACTSIRVGTQAWVWADDVLTEDVRAGQRIEKLADGLHERIAVATKSRLDTFLPDRAIAQDAVIAAVVRDSLLTPPTGRGCGPLLPSMKRRRYEIWLGPGGRGQNLLWSAPWTPVENSVTYTDNFNRTGTFDGSTFSGGTATWGVLDGALTLPGTVARGLNIPAETQIIAVGLSDVDTDVSFADMNVVVWTRAGSSALYTSITTRSNAAGTNGYQLFTGFTSGDAADNGLYAVSQDSVLDTDATSFTTGIRRVEADGSSIEGYVGGSLVLGPITNSGEASGAGNRKAYFDAFSNNSTNDIDWDDFSYGDLVAGVLLALGVGAVGLTGYAATSLIVSPPVPNTAHIIIRPS